MHSNKHYNFLINSFRAGIYLEDRDVGIYMFGAAKSFYAALNIFDVSSLGIEIKFANYLTIN